MEKPLPRITPVDAPFWEAANEGRLIAQRCLAKDCGHFFLYPRTCCPYCGGGALEWKELSGLGRVRSHTLVHRPQHPSFAAEAPCCFLAVDLDEGPLIYAERAPGPKNEAPTLGERVKVVFLEHAQGRKIPYFALEGQSSA